MNRSPEIDKLSAAFVQFQSELTAVKKEADNPFFKSKYADLSSMIEAVREPMKKNGLAFSQFPTGDGGLTTILVHESGQFIEGEMTIKSTTGKPQDVGSAITYGRRYALGAVLGIATENDDDGNAASKAKKPTGSKMTEAQKGEIDALCERLSEPKANIVKRCKEVYGISYTELSETQASGVILGLKKRIEAKK